MRDDPLIHAPVRHARLTHHVFVCIGASCAAHDAEATLQALREALASEGLLYGKPGGALGTPQGRVMVTTCGSVGLCAVGPALLVYPDGVWYYGVTPRDAREIVASHLLSGQPVEARIALRMIGPPPGEESA